MRDAAAGATRERGAGSVPLTTMCAIATDCREAPVVKAVLNSTSRPHARTRYHQETTLLIQALRVLRTHRPRVTGRGVIIVDAD